MKTRDPLAGLSAFVALAESLNFGAVAERLQMSRATVSAQVADLENRLGVRLFHRSTRAVRLTEAGEAYRVALGGVVGQVTQAGQIAQSYQTAGVGRIRLTAPDELCEKFVVPAMAAFLAQQPGITVDIDITSRRVDVIKDGFDLAIRASLAIEPNLIVRRLGTSPVTITAAPSYLERKGIPETPDDLAAHDIVHHSGLAAGGLWVMRRGDEERRVPVAAHVSSNSGATLRDAAVAGLGITYLPEVITGDALRAGQLVRVLPEWKFRAVDVNAVYPSNRNITPKVRRFVIFLAQQFVGHADFMS
jgi:DNA-binding transcriptional LysR family regulator